LEAEASKVVVPDSVAPALGMSTLVAGVAAAVDEEAESATAPTTMTIRSAATDVRSFRIFDLIAGILQLSMNECGPW
jgi:hypothetical protein